MFESRENPPGTVHHDDPAERAARWWPGLLAAFLAALANYLVAVALIALALVSAGSTVSVGAVLAGAVPAWLAAHHVPLVLAGTSLGVLPLLLTVGSALVIAGAVRWAVRRQARSGRSAAGRTVLIVSATYAVLGAVVAGGLGGAVESGPLEACVVCGAVAAAGATCGAWWNGDVADAIALRVDDAMHIGMRAGCLALGVLTAAAGILTLGVMAFDLPELAASYSRAGVDGGGAFGLTALSLLYLPNALIAAVSFVVGPGFAVGEAMVTPLHTASADLPAFPLLAILPDAPAASWWMAVFAVPLFVGAATGWWCRHASSVLSVRLRAVAVAAATASTGVFALAAMSGGQLGGGALESVSMSPLRVAMAVFAWIAVPAALVVWWAGPADAEATAQWEEWDVEDDVDQDVLSLDPADVAELDALSTPAAHDGPAASDTAGVGTGDADGWSPEAVETAEPAALLHRGLGRGSRGGRIRWALTRGRGTPQRSRRGKDGDARQRPPNHGTVRRTR